MPVDDVTTPPTDPVQEPKAPQEEEKNAAYWRRQAESSQRETANLKREKMGEIERAKAEAEEARHDADKARAESKTYRNKTILNDLAAKAGAVNSNRVAQLLAGEVEIGEDGSAKGYEKSIAGIRKDFPSLFAGVPKINSGGGGVSRESSPTSTDPFSRMREQMNELRGG